MQVNIKFSESEYAAFKKSMQHIQSFGGVDNQNSFLKAIVFQALNSINGCQHQGLKEDCQHCLMKAYLFQYQSENKLKSSLKKFLKG